MSLVSRKILKTTSAILAAAFLLQDISFANPDLKPLSLLPKKSDTVVAQKRLALPASAARVEDAWLSGNKLVYLIQDPHSNPTGQLNVATTLKHLSAETIFLEAGSGNESLSDLRSLVDAKKTERIAHSLVRNLKLQGSEYHDLTSDKKFTLWGVEDMALYNEALEAYRKVAGQKEALKSYLNKMESTLAVLRPSAINPFLEAFLRSKEAFDKGTVSFTDHFEVLARQKENLSLNSAYPALKELGALKHLEKKIDFSKATIEQNEVMRGLSAEDKETLAESLNPSKISPKEIAENEGFYALLEEKAGKAVLEAKPELSKYLDYVKRARRMDWDAVLKEKDLLEHEIMKGLAINAGEAEFILAYENLNILKKLLDLTVTPDEYRLYAGRKETFRLEDMTGFLNERLRQLGDHYDKALYLDENFGQMVKTAERFYELTYRRDEKFLSQMQAKLGEASEAVLITGGYHAPNLKALFKQNNISYISIIPQISSVTDQKKYESVLLREFKTTPNLTLKASRNHLMAQRIGRESFLEAVGPITSIPAAPVGARLAASEDTVRASDLEYPKVSREETWRNWRTMEARGRWLEKMTLLDKMGEFKPRFNQEYHYLRPLDLTDRMTALEDKASKTPLSNDEADELSRKRELSQLYPKAIENIHKLLNDKTLFPEGMAKVEKDLIIIGVYSTTTLLYPTHAKEYSAGLARRSPARRVIYLPIRFYATMDMSDPMVRQMAADPIRFNLERYALKEHLEKSGVGYNQKRNTLQDFDRKWKIRMNPGYRARYRRYHKALFKKDWEIITSYRSQIEKEFRELQKIKHEFPEYKSPEASADLSEHLSSRAAYMIAHPNGRELPAKLQSKAEDLILRALAVGNPKLAFEIEEYLYNMLFEFELFDSGPLVAERVIKYLKVLIRVGDYKRLMETLEDLENDIIYKSKDKQVRFASAEKEYFAAQYAKSYQLREWIDDLLSNHQAAMVNPDNRRKLGLIRAVALQKFDAIIARFLKIQEDEEESTAAVVEEAPIDLLETKINAVFKANPTSPSDFRAVLLSEVRNLPVGTLWKEGEYSVERDTIVHVFYIDPKLLEDGYKTELREFIEYIFRTKGGNSEFKRLADEVLSGARLATAPQAGLLEKIEAVRTLIRSSQHLSSRYELLEPAFRTILLMRAVNYLESGKPQAGMADYLSLQMGDLSLDASPTIGTELEVPTRMKNMFDAGHARKVAELLQIPVGRDGAIEYALSHSSNSEHQIEMYRFLESHGLIPVGRNYSLHLNFYIPRSVEPAKLDEASAYLSAMILILYATRQRMGHLLRKDIPLVQFKLAAGKDKGSREDPRRLELKSGVYWPSEGTVAPELTHEQLIRDTYAAYQVFLEGKNWGAFKKYIDDAIEKLGLPRDTVINAVRNSSRTSYDSFDMISGYPEIQPSYDANSTHYFETLSLKPLVENIIDAEKNFSDDRDGLVQIKRDLNTSLRSLFGNESRGARLARAGMWIKAAVLALVAAGVFWFVIWLRTPPALPSYDSVYDLRAQHFSVRWVDRSSDESILKGDKEITNTLNQTLNTLRLLGDATRLEDIEEIEMKPVKDLEPGEKESVEIIVKHRLGGRTDLVRVTKDASKEKFANLDRLNSVILGRQNTDAVEALSTYPKYLMWVFFGASALFFVGYLFNIRRHMSYQSTRRPLKELPADHPGRFKPRFKKGTHLDGDGSGARLAAVKKQPLRKEMAAAVEKAHDLNSWVGKSSIEVRLVGYLVITEPLVDGKIEDIEGFLNRFGENLPKTAGWNPALLYEPYPMHRGIAIKHKKSGARLSAHSPVDVNAAREKLHLAEKTAIVERLRAGLESRLSGDVVSRQWMDIGAGSGQVTHGLSRLFGRTIAIEKDRSMAPVLRTWNIPNLRVISDDFFSFLNSFRGQRPLDFILMSHSISLYFPMAQRDELLKAALGTLKPGGYVAIVLNSNELQPGNNIDVRNRFMQKHRVNTKGMSTNMEDRLREWGYEVTMERVRIPHEGDRNKILGMVLAMLPPTDRNNPAIGRYVDQHLRIPGSPNYRIFSDQEIVWVKAKTASGARLADVTHILDMRKMTNAQPTLFGEWPGPVEVLTAADLTAEKLRQARTTIEKKFSTTQTSFGRIDILYRDAQEVQAMLDKPELTAIFMEIEALGDIGVIMVRADGVLGGTELDHLKASFEKLGITTLSSYFAETFAGLDLEGVEPMIHPSDGARLAVDNEAKKTARIKELMHYNFYDKYSDTAKRDSLLAYVKGRIEKLRELYPNKEWNEVLRRADLPWMVFPAYVLSAQHVRGNQDDYLFSFDIETKDKEQRIFFAKELLSDLPEDLAGEFVLKELLRETLSEEELRKVFPVGRLSTWVSNFAKRNVVPEKMETFLWELESTLIAYVQNLNDVDGSAKDRKKEGEIRNRLNDLMRQAMSLKMESTYLKDNLIKPAEARAKAEGGLLTYAHLYDAMIKMGLFDVLLRKTIEKLRIAIEDGDIEVIATAMVSYVVYTQVMMETVDPGLNRIGKWPREEKEELDREANLFVKEMRDTFFQPIAKKKEYFDSFVPNTYLMDAKNLKRQIPESAAVEDYDSFVKARAIISDSKNLLEAMKNELEIGMRIPGIRDIVRNAEAAVAEMNTVYKAQLEIVYKKLGRSQGARLAVEKWDAFKAEAILDKSTAQAYHEVARNSKWHTTNFAFDLDPMIATTTPDSVWLDLSSGTGGPTSYVLDNLNKRAGPGVTIKKMFLTDVDFPMAWEFTAFAYELLSQPQYADRVSNGIEVYTLKFDKISKTNGTVLEIPGISEGSVTHASLENAIHLYSAAQRKTAFETVYKALKPGAAFVIGSGNISAKDMPANRLLLDDVFKATYDEAMRLVKFDERFSEANKLIEAAMAAQGAKFEKSRAGFLPPSPEREVLESELQAVGFTTEVDYHETPITKSDYRQFTLEVPGYVRMNFPELFVDGISEETRNIILEEAYSAFFREKSFRMHWTSIHAVKPQGARLSTAGQMSLGLTPTEIESLATFGSSKNNVAVVDRPGSIVLVFSRLVDGKPNFLFDLDIRMDDKDPSLAWIGETSEDSKVDRAIFYRWLRNHLAPVLRAHGFKKLQVRVKSTTPLTEQRSVQFFEGMGFVSVDQSRLLAYDLDPTGARLAMTDQEMRKIGMALIKSANDAIVTEDAVRALIPDNATEIKFKKENTINVDFPLMEAFKRFLDGPSWSSAVAMNDMTFSDVKKRAGRLYFFPRNAPGSNTFTFSVSMGAFVYFLGELLNSGDKREKLMARELLMEIETEKQNVNMSVTQGISLDRSYNRGKAILALANDPVVTLARVERYMKQAFNTAETRHFKIDLDMLNQAKQRGVNIEVYAKQYLLSQKAAPDHKLYVYFKNDRSDMRYEFVPKNSFVLFIAALLEAEPRLARKLVMEIEQQVTGSVSGARLAAVEDITKAVKDIQKDSSKSSASTEVKRIAELFGRIPVEISAETEKVSLKKGKILWPEKRSTADTKQVARSLIGIAILILNAESKAIEGQTGFLEFKKVIVQTSFTSIEELAGAEARKLPQESAKSKLNEEEAAEPIVDVALVTALQKYVQEHKNFTDAWQLFSGDLELIRKTVGSEQNAKVLEKLMNAYAVVIAQDMFSKNPLFFDQDEIAIIQKEAGDANARVGIKVGQELAETVARFFNHPVTPGRAGNIAGMNNFTEASERVDTARLYRYANHEITAATFARALTASEISAFIARDLLDEIKKTTAGRQPLGRLILGQSSNVAGLLGGPTSGYQSASGQLLLTSNASSGKTKEGSEQKRLRLIDMPGLTLEEGYVIGISAIQDEVLNLIAASSSLKTFEENFAKLGKSSLVTRNSVLALSRHDQVTVNGYSELAEWLVMLHHASEDAAIQAAWQKMIKKSDLNLSQMAKEQGVDANALGAVLLTHHLLRSFLLSGSQDRAKHRALLIGASTDMEDTPYPSIALVAAFLTGYDAAKNVEAEVRQAARKEMVAEMRGEKNKMPRAAATESVAAKPDAPVKPGVFDKDSFIERIQALSDDDVKTLNDSYQASKKMMLYLVTGQDKDASVYAPMITQLTARFHPDRNAGDEFADRVFKFFDSLKDFLENAKGWDKDRLGTELLAIKSLAPKKVTLTERVEKLEGEFVALRTLIEKEVIPALKRIEALHTAGARLASAEPGELNEAARRMINGLVSPETAAVAARTLKKLYVDENKVTLLELIDTLKDLSSGEPVFDEKLRMVVYTLYQTYFDGEPSASRKSVRVINPSGLTMSAISKKIEMLRKIEQKNPKAVVYILHKDQVILASSIWAMLQLAPEKGDEVQIIVVGIENKVEAERTIIFMTELFENYIDLSRRNRSERMFLLIEAAKFAERVYAAQRQEGSLAVGDSVLTIKQSRFSGFVDIYAYGELVRENVSYTRLPQAKASDKPGLNVQLGLSMSDLKLLLEKADSIFEEQRPAQELDTIKATGVIDLSSLNKYPQQFDMLAELMIEKLNLAKSREWGREAVFLLEGPEALKTRVMDRVSQLYPEQAFIFSEIGRVPTANREHMTLLTTPDSSLQVEDARYFFLEALGEKDIPNFLPGIWAALTTARFAKLEASDKAFGEFIAKVSSLLGRPIENPEHFIQALNGDRILSILFALPPIVRSLDKWIQGARLATQMTRQSA